MPCITFAVQVAQIRPGAIQYANCQLDMLGGPGEPKTLQVLPLNYTFCFAHMESAPR